MTPEFAAPQEENSPPAAGNDGELVLRDDRARIATANGATVTPPEKLQDESDEEANPDQALLDHPEWDVATMLNAATFDTVVPSAVLAARSAIYQTLNFNGLFSFDPYSMEGYFRFMIGEIDADGHKIKNADDDDDDDTMAGALREGRERMERQREIEEWAHAEHSYAGLEMTGEEWSKFSDELKNDTPLHRWLVDQIKKKENKTDAQAQSEAAKIALLAKMQSVPKDQWTSDMKSLDQYLNDNPAERARYNEYIKNADDQRKGLALGQANTLEKTATDSKQENSIATQADSLTAKPFPGAPNASDDFQAAASPPVANVKAPDPSTPAPQIAAASPPPQMPGGSGGFDMS